MWKLTWKTGERRHDAVKISIYSEASSHTGSREKLKIYGKFLGKHPRLIRFFFEVATFKKYVLLHLSPLKFPKIFGADFFQGAIFMGLVTIFYFEQFLCIVSGTFWLTLHLCFDLLQTIYELFMQRWTTKSNISPSMVFRFYCWFFAAVIFFMDSKIIQKTALFGM